MTLFTRVAGRRDGQRHLILTGGATIAFPRALCESPIRLQDAPLAYPCPTCRTKALGAVAVALETLDLPDLAVRVARHAHDQSFETPAAQSGWTESELRAAGGDR